MSRTPNAAARRFADARRAPGHGRRGLAIEFGKAASFCRVSQNHFRCPEVCRRRLVDGFGNSANDPRNSPTRLLTPVNHPLRSVKRSLRLIGQGLGSNLLEKWQNPRISPTSAPFTFSMLVARFWVSNPGICERIGRPKTAAGMGAKSQVGAGRSLQNAETFCRHPSLTDKVYFSAESRGGSV
jgi:hypothetical protein